MSKEIYIPQEEFEELNSQWNKVRLEAHGIPSQIVYKEGVMYSDLVTPAEYPISKEQLISRIEGVKEGNVLYSKIMKSAEEFHKKAMRVKSLCTKYGFVVDGKTYLPYWVDVCKKIKIGSSMMNNNPNKLKESLEFISILRDFYNTTLEIYMFTPVCRGGSYQDSKHTILESSAPYSIHENLTIDVIERRGREEIKKEDGLSEKELDFYLDLNEKRYLHFKKHLVFETNEYIELYDVGDFGAGINVDCSECFTSGCGFGMRNKSERVNASIVEHMLEILESSYNKDDKQYLYFL